MPPVERILGGIYTADEVQERTGLDAAALVRMRRLLGLRPPRRRKPPRRRSDR